MTMRGLTAAYLMRRIHPWQAGDTQLLHAAAGGLAGFAPAARVAGLRGHGFGAHPPLRSQILAVKGSLTLTRPALADFIANPAEKAELASELFGHVAAGRIQGLAAKAEHPDAEHPVVRTHPETGEKIQ